MNRHILVLCLWALAFFATTAQGQIDLRVTTTNDTYRTEPGWQILNTATNVSYLCHPAGTTITPGTVTISVPAGTYVVRGFDAFGDCWQGMSVTVSYVATGQTLVNSAQYLCGYSSANRQSNVCPGPTTPLNANQTIATFTVVKPCLAPVITSQPPLTMSVCPGQPFTLTVGSDLTNGTWEWFRDSVSLGVTTSPTLTVANPTMADSGNYACVLRDNCNPSIAFIRSGSCRVRTVVPPTITLQTPAARTVCESANDTLRIRAIGVGRSFQWFKDGVAIAGARDSNLVLINAQASTTNGDYYCLVSGTCPPATASVTTKVTVAAKPRITREPSGLDVCPGSNNALGVSAVGSNLAYQWYKDGQPLPNETRDSIKFSNYNYSMNGQYYCFVRSDVPNPNGCLISIQSRTVRVSGFSAPIVETQPKSIDGCTGTVTTLVGTFKGTGLSYQWFKDGKALDGQNANAIVISGTKATDAGKYVLVATGTCGLTGTSDTATVTVLSKPAITKQPQAATLTVGERLSLSVEASDIRSIQWYKNDLAIKGATTAAYSISSVTKADAGYYSARVTNGCGAVVSTIAKVDVNDPVRPTPAITLAQESVDFGDIPVGYTKSVSVPAMITNTGNAPLTITAINLSPSDFTLSNAPGLPFDIAPGADRALTLVAAPAVKGRVNGTMTIRSNATATPQVTVSLSANYLMRYTHASSQSFGLIETGKTTEKCITVTNSSTQDITIDQATVTGLNAAEFSVVTPMPVSIAAGASADVCVKFAPGTVGKKTAQLQVRSANGGNSSVDLDGTAETPGGVIDAAEFGLTVGPNPMHNTLDIRFGKSTAGMQISLVDASGSAVYTMSHDAVDAGAVVRLNTGGTVASGGYMLTIRTGSDVVVVPVTVIK